MSGVHRCKDDAVCKTYQDMFKNANNFCQIIWDNSFEVVPDDKTCIRFREGETAGNKEVARLRAEEMVIVLLSYFSLLTVPFLFNCYIHHGLIGIT